VKSRAQRVVAVLDVQILGCQECKGGIGIIAPSNLHPKQKNCTSPHFHSQSDSVPGRCLWQPEAILPSRQSALRMPRAAIPNRAAKLVPCHGHGRRMFDAYTAIQDYNYKESHPWHTIFKKNKPRKLVYFSNFGITDTPPCLAQLFKPTKTWTPKVSSGCMETFSAVSHNAWDPMTWRCQRPSFHITLTWLSEKIGEQCDDVQKGKTSLRIYGKWPIYRWFTY